MCARCQTAKPSQPPLDRPKPDDGRVSRLSTRLAWAERDYALLKLDGHACDAAMAESDIRTMRQELERLGRRTT